LRESNAEKQPAAARRWAVSQSITLIEEPDHWQDYQHIRDWIEKLLRRDPERAYTRAQREAVGRIIATRTPFVGWGGFSVPELIVAARKYVADYDYEDEIFLNELHEKGATR
jgi:hypothetical protein